MVELLAAIVVGSLVGWFANQLVPGIRLRLLGDTLVGIGGALIGLLIFPRLHLHLGGGFTGRSFAVVPAAIAGAVILLLIARLIGRARQKTP